MCSCMSKVSLSLHSAELGVPTWMAAMVSSTIVTTVSKWLTLKRGPTDGVAGAQGQGSMDAPIENIAKVITTDFREFPIASKSNRWLNCSF